MQSKFSQNPVKIQSKFSQNSVKIRSKFCQNSVKNPFFPLFLEIRQISSKNKLFFVSVVCNSRNSPKIQSKSGPNPDQSKFSQNSVKIQSKSVKIQSNFSQNSVKIQSKFSQNSIKIQFKLSNL